MKQIITSNKLAIAMAIPLTMVGWIFSSASFAGGSFSLNQLLSSSQTSPQSEKLIAEISNVLRSNKINTQQVKCTGTRLGGRYSSLPDTIAPFNCRLSNNVALKINAQNFVILPSGRATPIENAKNFELMPKPVSLTYRITSWNWNKAH